MELGFFLDLADNTDDKFSHVVSPVKEWSDIPLHRRPVTLVRSMVRGCKMDSTDEPTCCKRSDGFKLLNRHGDELFGKEKMELTHRHSSFDTYLVCLNDDTNKMFNPLPNLEYDSGIDNNDIDNPISLSNTLF